MVRWLVVTLLFPELAAPRHNKKLLPPQTEKFNCRVLNFEGLGKALDNQKDREIM